jgi:predicted Zn-dependent protease
MEEITPEPKPPEPPPSGERMREILREKRSLRPRYTVFMVAAALAAGWFLSNLKHGSLQEQAAKHEKQALSIIERDAINKQIEVAATQRYGGESKNYEQRMLVQRVGNAINTKTDIAKKSAGPLRFHLLAELNSINLYALSTGDVYITTAMLNRMQTEAQLAAALAHGAAHTFKADGMQSSTVNKTTSYFHSAEQEAAADVLTVKLMSQAGYKPQAFATMLSVLAGAYRAGADVAFFTTHPNSEGRLEAIDRAITDLYPNGVPKELSE